jgi:hypothetical protein
MNGDWTVERFEALTPGPQAAVALASVVPGRLSGAVRMAWTAAVLRQRNHYDALVNVGVVGAVEALDAPRFLEPPAGDRWSSREELRDLAADEVAAAFAWTDVAAGRRVDFAEACVKRLPGLHEAMLAGRVDYPKAKLFIDGTECLSEAKARAVVDSLLDKATSRTTGQLRPMLSRRVAKADPEAAQRKKDKAHARRELGLYPDGDGTATLSLRGAPTHRAEQAFGRVHAIATAIKNRGDDRLLDQIRLDVALDLLQGIPVPGPDGQDAQKDPKTGVAGTSVELTIPVTTLMGLAEEPGMWGSWGPILADAVRDTANALRKAPWRITATHPDTGVAIWSGTTRRRPSVEDLDYARARDRTCRIPHCNKPAIRCDIDHNVERQDGGPTHPCNLGPLCPKHHRRKSRKIWDVKQTGDGRFEIHSPLGVRHVVEPEPVDDTWQLPDDLWDWTDDAEFAEWRDLPTPEPHLAMAIDRPDEPEFRRDDDW